MTDALAESVRLAVAARERYRLIPRDFPKNHEDLRQLALERHHELSLFDTLRETPEGVDMAVFVTEDSVSFISENSDADKLTALKKSIHDFAVTEYKKIITKKNFNTNILIIS